jgi:WD40 repeat protein
MSSHANAPEVTGSPCETESRETRTARIYLPFWTRRRLGLVVALLLLLPWFPLRRPVPEHRPHRRASGASGGGVWKLALGNDGRTFATIDELSRARLVQAAEIQGHERTIDLGSCMTALTFSSGGRYLAVGGNRPDVLLYRVGGAAPGRPLGIPVQETSDLAISPDGRTLAVSSYRSNDIVLWDIDTARERMTLRGHSSAVLHLAFGPDGRSLASWGRDKREILIWDLDARRPRQRLDGLPSPVLALGYSPDGRWLACSTCAYKPVWVWDLRAGGQVRLIAGHTLPTRSLAFSPDSRILATAAGDGRASFWNVATGRELMRLDTEIDLFRNIAFSQDGTTLAAAGSDHNVRFWDMTTLAESLSDRD